MQGQAHLDQYTEHWGNMLSPLDEMFSANAGHETSPTKVTNNFSFTV
jgi:hypothetical protein